MLLHTADNVGKRLVTRYVTGSMSCDTVEKMAASIDEAYDPKNYTRHLYEIASTFEVDASVPIKRYYRSGAEMERQVRVASD